MAPAPGMKRGTYADEPVPTSRVWMAVDEKAVARFEMSRTAELIASDSWVAVLAR